MAHKHPPRSSKRQVFLNAPFDSEYQPLFEAMVFAVMDCGYVPRCSLESSDGGHIRLQKLLGLIQDCPHGIHDISRTELDREHSLPRFNMPFELGLFLGAKHYRHAWKRCLILDRERFRFQKYISDISGQDIKSHDQNAAKLIEAVRDWLAEDIHPIRIPGGKQIHRRFGIFKEDYPELCRESQLDHTRFNFNDFVNLISAWMAQAPLPVQAKSESGDWTTVSIIENGRIVQKRVLTKPVG